MALFVFVMLMGFKKSSGKPGTRSEFNSPENSPDTLTITVNKDEL